MDFSNDLFRSSTTNATLSSDTMSHTNMVLACRWTFGSTAGPESESHTSAPARTAPAGPANDSRSKRFAPCRGRLYHQLLCGHRIRTDIVEDCGPNCLDPLTPVSQLHFICHDCIQHQFKEAWAQREAQHNNTYPPIELMSKAQYEQWYDEHRKLEVQFTEDRVAFEIELKASTRPSNACSAPEVDQEDTEFSNEMNALSLALTSTNDSVASNDLPIRTNRSSLPSDDAMQIHWGLSALSIDRGSCGLEYSSHHAPHATRNAISTMTNEELWRLSRPR